MVAAHRRTLHFPTALTLAAVPASLPALAAPGPVTVAVALFVVAAALHCVSDAAGGGLELRPWEATSERAVYDHVRGRWLAPRRWVRYDGAPEDLALAGVLAVPSLYVFDGTVELAVLAALAVSVGYVLVRKVMIDAAERVVTALPESLQRRVPERVRRDFL
jgi:hypothetical protein